MLEAQQVGGLLNHLNTFDGHSWRLRKKKTKLEEGGLALGKGYRSGNAQLEVQEFRLYLAAWAKLV